MYESILKVATDDPEFEFKVRSSGYPLSLDIQNVEDTQEIGTVITFCALAFPVIIVYFALSVIDERVSMLKQFQTLNGMTKMSY